MRQVLSLSLPSKTVQSVKKRVKKRGFDSVSSYFNHLIKEDSDLISEDQLWQSILQGRKEYAEGKTIKASSLDDLI